MSKRSCETCVHFISAVAARVHGPGPDDGDLYVELDRVLAMARAQAAEGKGKERHAVPGQPFEEQGIVADCVALGSAQGALFQIIKKAKESERLATERAIAELLGVINYAAAAIVVRERLAEHEEPNR